MDYKAKLSTLRTQLSVFYSVHCYFCGVEAGTLLVSTKHRVKAHRQCLISSKGNTLADNIIAELNIITTEHRRYDEKDVWEDEYGFWHVKNVASLYLSPLQAERACDDVVRKKNSTFRNGNEKLGLDPKVKPDTRRQPNDDKVIGSLVWGSTEDGIPVKAVVLGTGVSRNELKNTLSRYHMAYSQDKKGMYTVRTDNLEITRVVDLTLRGYTALRTKAEPTKLQQKKSQSFKTDKHYSKGTIGVVPLKDCNGHVIGETINHYELMPNHGYLEPEVKEVKPKIVRPLITKKQGVLTNVISSNVDRRTRGWTGDASADSEAIARVKDRKWDWAHNVR